MSPGSDVAEILVDWRERRDRGEEVTLEDIVREHPEHADALREHAAALDAAGAALLGDRDVESLRADGDVVGVDAQLIAMSPGRYVDFRPAGEGGMGIVYWALDTQLNRQVAFKIVRPARTTGTSTPAAPVDVVPPGEDTPASRAFAELKGRFLQEAWVTGGMEHPGIVPVYELGETPEGVPYYTMRFVRGERTLATAIEAAGEAGMEERLALLEPFLKVCDTIRYAHARGIVHRDLKPQNIALGEFGEVVVLDWGLARLRENKVEVEETAWRLRIDTLREATDFRTIAGGLGTPGYMSPEAAKGDPDEVDDLSDVYSLGAILYEILTGRLPHDVSTYEAFVREIGAVDPPPALAVDPAVPAPLSRLCERALSRSRTERPQSVDELASSIRTWQVESEVAREIEGWLHEAKAAFDAAEGLRGDALLDQLDRAQGPLSQVLARDPSNKAALAHRSSFESLREEGIRQRERASRTRLLRIVGTVALVVAMVAGFVIAAAMEAERDAKSRALDEVWRLGVAKRARDLLSEADRLWPAVPGKVADMTAWIDRVDEVLESREEHASRLEALRASAIAHTGPRGPERWTFASDRDDLQYHVLSGLLDDLEQLEDPVNGVRRLVLQRRDFANRLKQRSIHDRKAAWDRTISAIAASPDYGGLRIEPQLGLVPLGPDPDSKLFEFAHLGSGQPPVRDEATRRFEMQEDSGIVLVLIPGGTFFMGAQRDDRRKPNYDLGALYDEIVHEVTLSPYFISKYECTQAQWKRMTGGLVPSNTSPQQSPGVKGITMRNPVEQVSWDDAVKWLGRYGLRLPSEAQWEHACRAGTQTPWFHGDDVRGLAKIANIADQTLGRTGSHWIITPEVDDGITFHAPVGSLAANAFGLHDVHGNVSEWCEDTYEMMLSGPVTDPVLRGPGNRVYRGGASENVAKVCRSAFRPALAKEQSAHCLGVRPGRALTED